MVETKNNSRLLAPVLSHFTAALLPLYYRFSNSILVNTQTPKIYIFLLYIYMKLTEKSVLFIYDGIKILLGAEDILNKPFNMMYMT